jgi:hypothetical protein
MNLSFEGGTLVSFPLLPPLPPPFMTQFNAKQSSKSCGLK